MFSYQKGQTYFRDSFVPFAEANVNIASSPVLYGLSVYTVFGANWNEKDGKLYVFRLREHYNRLVQSARIMDFHSFAKEWDYERFEKTMLELLRRNEVAEDVLVRVTIFIDELLAGTKIHGLKNSLSAFVYPAGGVLPASGINVCVSSWRRNSDNAIPARAKVNGSYVNASLMKNEAILNGYDDAIALDDLDHVAEGTVANLFVVRDGTLLTPDPSTDILEGITRSTILKLASDSNMPVIERSIDRSELYICDEIFMCGSSVRITPVLSVDKRIVGDGEPGSLTRKLATLYDQALHGATAQYAEWRSAV